MLFFNRVASQFLPRARGGNGNQTVIIVLAVVGGLFFAMLVCGGVLIALLLPAIQQARSAARASQSRNNLKQIGLALHNYHDAVDTFPPGGVYAEDGTPHHGWITMLLPYLDYGFVAEQIDYNKPWDDPANAPAFQATIPVTLDLNVDSPSTDARGNGLSHYAGNELVFRRNEGLTIRDVADGTSNTVMGGSAYGNYKAWGAPDNTRDLTLGLNASPDGFGTKHPAGTQLLMMDGSVRNISPDVSPDVLKALATPAGNEPPGRF